MSHNIDEAMVGLRDALVGDSELTDLLGDADQIYREQQPGAVVSYPIITMIIENDNPETGLTATGVWRPDIEIGIQAKRESDCRKILGVLNANWNIPLNRKTPITTDNFAITLMRQTNSLHIGAIKQIGTDDRIHLINAFWQLRINKT